MTNSKRWFYVDAGKQVGPVRSDEIEDLLARGIVSRSTLVWAEGLDEWERADRHFSSGRFTQPPALNLDGVHEKTASDPGFRAAGPNVGPDGLYLYSPGRSFSEAISVCLSKYFHFSGRASRSEYWYFMLFTILANMMASVLDSILFGMPPWGVDYGPVSSLVWLGLLLPSLAVGWRRLHDINRSGWWIGGFFLVLPAATLLIPAMFPALFYTENTEWIGFLMILPGIALFIYLIVMFFFLCTKGDLLPNRYG